MFRQKIVVIEGPTASGKTALAIEVAKALNTVIISSDSRQFYREMTIGTAKPSDFELAQVQHYFINSHSIQQPLSAGKFAEEAGELLHSPDFSDYEYIVVVGGSGMFTDALVSGIDEIPSDVKIQDELNQQLLSKGLQNLQEELKQLDPEYFETVDQQNSRRIIRALEVIRLTGLPYSSFRTAAFSDSDAVYRFHLIPDRSKLYDRINQRVDKMIEEGLLDEVRSLIGFEQLRPLQTVGYQELFSFIHGQTSFENAIELIKQHTRNYAKRQLTWFRKKDAFVLKNEAINDQKQEILDFLAQKSRKN